MARYSYSVPLSAAEKVQRLLSSRGLSLSEVARASQSLAAGNPLYRVPRNLYSTLRNRFFSPNLYQVFALSVVTGYRLEDWFSVFGVSLREVLRFQAMFPALRTVELDAMDWDSGGRVPWFKENKKCDFSAPLMPLTAWLSLSTPVFHPVPGPSQKVERYIKIGIQDAFAFPELLPGSIVRIRPQPSSFALPEPGSKKDRRLFLVRQSHGLVCTRLCRSAEGKFVLCSRHLPYAPVELQENKTAAVLGVADLELRRLEGSALPVVPPDLGRFWTPRPLSQPVPAAHFGELIRRARLLAGVAFREASRRTGIISRELKDRRYYCSPSSLSDCETRKLPPRHIQKLISLSAVYFIAVSDLLRAAGIDTQVGGKLPVPESFFDSPDTVDSVEPSRFLAAIERRAGRPPYFLNDSIGIHFGLPRVSVRDVFWAGGIRRLKHPGLAGALFFVLDRRRKHPRPALSLAKWEQPVYVLQLRDGAYLCGHCTLQNETLILNLCSAAKSKVLRLRNRIDAEVVGRVVGVARQLR